MLTLLVGVAIGAVGMDYLWARRTGVDRLVYAAIKRKFSK